MQSKSLNGLIILITLIFFYLFNASVVFADFYVIATGSKGVGTKITSLPYTIASPGFYYINKELSCAAGSHGITITTDNVTLDLMGFSLTGPGDTSSYSGIYMVGRTNVEIRNGTVKNFGDCGIRDAHTNGTGHRIINVRLQGNQNDGMDLRGKSHLVKACTSINNGDVGIRVPLASTVTGSICYGNTGYGIYGNMGSTITNNNCHDNSYGIYTGNATIVTGNMIYANSSGGIRVFDGSTVNDNNCYDNTGIGIELSLYSLASRNTCYDNSGGNLSSCFSCLFVDNIAPDIP